MKIASSAKHPGIGCLGVDDGHLDLDTGLDGDGGDLLHHVGGRVQVDQALVDAQLEAVPGVGTLNQGLTPSPFPA